MPRRARPHPGRLVLVGVLSWLLFGLAWWRVIRLRATVGWVTVVAVLACALVVLAVDLWWVRHNRRIYRTKGPRRGRPVVDQRYTTDRLGRPLSLPRDALAAPQVRVFLAADGTKVYRPESAAP